MSYLQPEMEARPSLACVLTHSVRLRAELPPPPPLPPPQDI